MKYIGSLHAIFLIISLILLILTTPLIDPTGRGVVFYHFTQQHPELNSKRNMEITIGSGRQRVLLIQFYSAQPGKGSTSDRVYPLYRFPMLISRTKHPILHSS